MAQNYDGSLRFNTKLDNTGFKKGAQELAQEAKNAGREVEKAGKGIDKAFDVDAKKPSNALNEIGDKADKTAEQMSNAASEIQKAAEGINDALHGIGGPVDAADTGDIMESLDDLRAMIDSLRDIPPVNPLEGASEGADELAGAMQSVQEAGDVTPKIFDEMISATDEERANLDEIFSQLESLGQDRITIPTPEIDDDDMFGREKEAVDSLKAKIQQMGDMLKYIFGKGNRPAGDDAYSQELEKQRAELEEINRVRQEMGAKPLQLPSISENDPDFADKLHNVVAQAKEVGAGIKGAIGQAFTSAGTAASSFGGKAKEALSGARSAATGLGAAMRDGATGLADFARTAAGSAVNGIKQLGAGIANAAGAVKNFVVSGVQGALSGIRNFGTAVATAAKNAAAGFTQMLGPVGQVAATIGKGVFAGAAYALRAIGTAAIRVGGALASMGLQAAVAGLRKLASAAAGAAANLARMVGGGVIGGLKKLGSAILGVGSANNKMNGGFKLSFGTILKYGFGIRSLYFLFNRLRRAMLDGFSQIAAGDSQLSGSINGLKTALANLKLSFASAFAPIVSVVLPYITAMVNALSTAINTIGMCRPPRGGGN